jgi:hypothetical protein
MLTESTAQYGFNVKVVGVVHSDGRVKTAVLALKRWLGSMEPACAQIECEKNTAVRDTPSRICCRVGFVKFSHRA